MIDGLQPYEAYKDSGLEWLGDVPAHWDLVRAKFLLREIDERSVTGAEEMLSVSHKTGVTPRSEKNVTMFVAESNVGHKLCQPGDVVVNTMWAWMAALGVASSPGIVSPSYGVYRPIRSDQFVSAYLDLLLRSPAYRHEYVVRSTGITDSRLRLYPDSFLRIPLLCPPPGDQAASVRFLHHADRQIRRHISMKQRLISLLQEQRRAIITRAVTGGGDTAVRLQQSRVEPGGHLPEHWEMSRIKVECECLNARRVPLSSTQRGQMAVRAYDYYGASGVIDKVDDYLFDDDLILIAEDGANLVLRNLPLAVVARGRFWVNNHAHVLRPRTGNTEYFAALLESIDYRPWITGAAQPKLTKDRLMSIPIAVAPRGEQDAIVDHIECEAKGLVQSIEVARQEIDLLREYRTALVADVVKGQLDVRSAARTLPDDAGDHGLLGPVAFDESEDVDDVDLDNLDQVPHDD